MYKFHNNVLPAAFHSFFFTKVTSVDNYNTRFAAKHFYYLPYARTNSTMANSISVFKVQLCGMLLMIM